MFPSDTIKARQGWVAIIRYLRSFACVLISFLMLGFMSLAHAVPVSVEVTWPNWSSDNRVVIKSPSGTTLATICDPANCFNAAADTNYSNTFNYDFPEDLDYIIELEDAFGDGWNGAGLVRVFSDSRLVFQDDGPVADFYSHTFDVSSQATNGARSCTALTGTWVAGSATTSSAVNVTASLSTQTGGAFAFLPNDNLSTVGAFSEPAAEGLTSLATRFNWDATPTAGDYAHDDSVTGTMSFTFDQPVNNPVFHFDRIGGIDSATANGTRFSLASGGSLVRLSGTPHFEVHEKFFMRTAHEAMATGATGETSQTTNLGMAAGSLYVTGVHSTVTFSLEGTGLEGTGGDVFESAVCAEPAESDWSDAPLTGTSYGSAQHIINTGVQLGANVTAEASAYDTPNADGDIDDGITLPTLTQGQSATINAAVSGAGGFLQGWIDWNDDGDWNDAGEQVATDLQFTSGTTGNITVPVTPPANAATTQTIARFRWSSTSGLNSTTPAADGEVEDYALTVSPSGGGGLTCPAGQSATASTGNASTASGAQNSANAIGSLAAAGSSATTTGVSARIRLTNDETTLTLELADTVPGNAQITFSLARDNDQGVVLIEGSADGTNYTSMGTYSSANGGTNGVLSHISYTAPANEIQFIRISRVSGRVWIDGVEYNNICVSSSPDLQASKSIAVYDPAGEGLYALPGNDVIYTITVSNAGDGAVDTDSIELIDILPPEIEFWNGDIDDGGPESFPVAFTQTVGTGMTLTYVTDVRFGTGGTAPANFAACSVIAPDNSYRPDLTYICLNPKGTLAAGDPDPTVDLSFRTRIK